MYLKDETAKQRAERKAREAAEAAAQEAAEFATRIGHITFSDKVDHEINYCVEKYNLDLKDVSVKVGIFDRVAFEGTKQTFAYLAYGLKELRAKANEQGWTAGEKRSVTCALQRLPAPLAPPAAKPAAKPATKRIRFNAAVYHEIAHCVKKQGLPLQHVAIDSRYMVAFEGSELAFAHLAWHLSKLVENADAEGFLPVELFEVECALERLPTPIDPTAPATLAVLAATPANVAEILECPAFQADMRRTNVWFTVDREGDFIKQYGKKVRDAGGHYQKHKRNDDRRLVMLPMAAHKLAQRIISKDKFFNHEGYTNERTLWFADASLDTIGDAVFALSSETITKGTNVLEACAAKYHARFQAAAQQLANQQAATQAEKSTEKPVASQEGTKAPSASDWLGETLGGGVVVGTAELMPYGEVFVYTAHATSDGCRYQAQNWYEDDNAFGAVCDQWETKQEFQRWIEHCMDEASLDIDQTLFLHLYADFTALLQADEQADESANEPADTKQEAQPKHDYSGKYLHSTNWRKRKLAGADFSGATVHDSDFAHADLEGANFAGADLMSTSFYGAILKDADFTGARLSFASLRGAHLAGANFHGVQAKGASFEHTVATGASFVDADINSALFHSANLQGADFTGAKAQNADFTGAKLQETTWHNTRTRGAIFAENNWLDAKVTGFTKLKNLNGPFATHDAK